MRLIIQDYKDVFIVLYSILLPWIIGIVLAKGITDTILAILFFPYAWYISIERLFIYLNWM